MEVGELKNIKVFKSTEEIVEALRLNPPEDRGMKYLAFYNSHMGGITTDPTFMSISIFDHMAVRGHSVFDTTYVINGKLYMIDRKIDRFFRSMSKAQIKSPITKENLRKLIFKIAAVTKEKNVQIRYWSSSGIGPLDIVNSETTKPSLFIVAIRDEMVIPEDGVQEFTVDTPIKPKFLANIKSTNYLSNILCALSAQEKGGYLGVQTTKDGFILETAKANLMFYTKDKDILTPETDEILDGTTVRRLVELLNEHKAEYAEDIRDVKYAKIHIDQIKKEALEMMILSRNEVISVIAWDGVPLPNGNGKITKILRSLLYTDYSDSQYAEAVDYSE